jgi:hypothetical protein
VITIAVFDPTTAKWIPLTTTALPAGVGATVDAPQHYLLSDGSILLRMTAGSSGVTLTPPLVTPVDGPAS